MAACKSDFYFVCKGGDFCLCPFRIGWSDGHEEPWWEWATRPTVQTSGYWCHQEQRVLVLAAGTGWSITRLLLCHRGVQVCFTRNIETLLRYLNSLDMLWLMWGLRSPFCSLSLQSVSEQQLANSGRSYQNHAVHRQRSPSQHHLLVHGSGSQHTGSKWSEPHVWTRQNSRYLHNTDVKGILSIDSVYWMNENLFPKPERYSSNVFFFFFLEYNFGCYWSGKVTVVPFQVSYPSSALSIMQRKAVLKLCWTFQRSGSSSRSNSLRLHLSNYVKYACLLLEGLTEFVPFLQC